MRVLCETRYGRMLVNDLDRYLGRGMLLYGEFSRSETRLFESIIRPGMVVADVGAYIGAHTLAFARMVGPTGVVLAYEPQRLLHQMLCANMALNNIDNVHCYHAAVGAERGTIKLRTVEPNVPNNFGAFSLAEIEGGNEAVSVLTLSTPCHFLKIDVEGMERDVLCGAEDMIRRSRPIMYIENDRPAKSKALIEKIEELGYAAYWHIAPLYDPDNWKKVSENVFGNISSMNMICVPADVKGFEKLDRATGSHVEYLHSLKAAA